MKRTALLLVLLAFSRSLLADANSFARIDLVSDRNNALLTDPSLVNPWGVPYFPTNGFWIANNGSSTATLYLGDVAGSPFVKSPLSVELPMSPTGVAVNPSSAFAISGSPAVLLFATETGTIRAWKPSLGTASVQVVSKPNAVYESLAIGFNGSAYHLYVADFRSGSIDVYDTNFTPVTLAGAFVDPALPAGYAPFHILSFASLIVVSYAVQDAAKHDPVPGPGKGIVDTFSADGIFLYRFISNGGALNAPCASLVASVSLFPGFPFQVLVANFGDGRINAFHASTGTFLGTLNDDAGNPIVIDGLRGITLGNNSSAGDVYSLYFTAGPNGGANGVFGKLVGVAPGSSTLTGLGAAVSMTEGQSSTVTVAEFNDANAPGTYDALIGWGDGNSSAGTIVPIGNGSYLVRGTHAYAEEAFSNSLTISVNDSSDGTANTFTGSAAVADAPLSAVGTTITPAPGVPFSAVVATFSDADPAGTATDYTAAIDWGDSLVSSGVIAAYNAGFAVTGTHAYAGAGPRTVTVTISDAGGAQATATTQALVGAAAPTLNVTMLLVLAAALAAVALRWTFLRDL